MLNKKGERTMEHIKSKIDVYTVKFTQVKSSILRESTIINYETYIQKYIKPYFKGKYIEDITIKEIEEFVAYLNSIKRYKTISNIVSVLKQILDLAVKDGIISNNPCRYIKLIKEEKKQEQDLATDEEIGKIIEAAKKTMLKGGIGIILSARLGLRRNEGLALKWGDLKYDAHNDLYLEIKNSLTRSTGDKSYKIGSTKTEESKRKIYLSEELTNLILDYKSEYKNKCKSFDDECFLIPRKYDEPHLFKLPSTYSYYFDSLKKEAGVRKSITLHSLRHYFVSKQIHNGIPIDVVKSWVGHKSIATTIDTYTHTSGNDIKAFKENL